MPKVRYVDFDGTLAVYDGWKGATSLGNPVPKMLQKVKKWIAQGDEVVIFTTRICVNDTWTKPEELEPVKKAIEDWCVKYLGVKLEITCEKGFFNVSYDDKVEHIQRNTGSSREEELLALIASMRKYPNKNDTGILDFVVRALTDWTLVQND